MNGSYTAAERHHVGVVKRCPCSVCGAPGPSDAHHIEQGLHWCVVALCKDCHQGAHNGWHGRKTIWRQMKMDELDALNVTLKNVGRLQ